MGASGPAVKAVQLTPPIEMTPLLPAAEQQASIGLTRAALRKLLQIRECNLRY